MQIKPKEGLELRPYQQKILDELAPMKSIGLFLGTGTGKTITSIMRLRQNPTEKVLVICPQSVIGQWQDVLETKFEGFDVLKWPPRSSVNQIDKRVLSEDYNTIVINFEKVFRMKNLEKVVKGNWTIIVDESHRIKAYGTPRKPVKTTHAVLRLGEKTDYKIILTATPTQGNYGGFIDYYPQMKFIDATKLPYRDFYKRHVIETLIDYGNSPYPVRKITGYKFTKEITDQLEKYCKRFTPKFHEQDPEHIKVKLQAPPSYKRVLRELAYKDIMITNVSQKRVALKTLLTGTISGKDMFDNRYQYVDNTTKIDWLKDFLQDTQDVVAVFYQYNVERDKLIELAEALGKSYILINGGTKDKYAEINRKDYDLVIGQFQAMSESLDGLHLRCHIEVFFSMPESSLTYKQAIGRIDRDGQTYLPIYYYLVTEKTVEDDIYKLIEQKVEFSEQTLDKLVIDY